MFSNFYPGAWFNWVGTIHTYGYRSVYPVATRGLPGFYRLRWSGVEMVDESAEEACDEWIIKELKCIKCSEIFSAEILKGSDPYWPMCDYCAND